MSIALSPRTPQRAVGSTAAGVALMRDTPSTHSMDLPYEASAAATTLFGFGVTFAGAVATTGVAISGFAQSPLDQLFGDARFGVDGRHLLVEFKREVGALSTDLSKPRRKRLLTLPTFGAGSSARADSRRGHWFGYGTANGVVFTPYLDGLQTAAEGSHPRDADVLTLSAFSPRFIAPPEGAEQVRRWAEASGLMLPPSVGLPWDAMLQYLQMLIASGSPEDSSGVEPPVAGYWISAHPAGGIATTAFNNDAHLGDLIALAQRGVNPIEQSITGPADDLPPDVPPPPTRRGPSR